MKKNNLLVIGGFGYKTGSYSGQTLRTRSIYKLLDTNIDKGQNKLEYFDTSDLKLNICCVFKLIKHIFTCNQVVILPAQRNLIFFFPVVYFVSKIRQFPILFIAIGGWLADFLNENPHYVKMLKGVNCILVQTKLLSRRLRIENNLFNTAYLPNFRFYDYCPDFKKHFYLNNLKLVFMSRINRKKGYEMIFNAAEFFETNDYQITFDFYGQLYENDREDFQFQILNHTSVSYKGVLEPEKIYSTLGNYDILVLPTQYYTEGFPGAILDAYISGIPVIVTKWLHAEEFVDDGINGYIIPFNNGIEDFIARILSLYNNRRKLNEFKINAYNTSKSFSPNIAWSIINPLL